MSRNRLNRWTPAAIVVIAGTTNALAVGLFGSSFELSSLNGSNGFVINGIDADDRSGRSVSVAGDINGDGIDDLVIGAYRADPNGESDAGKTYVVFGSAAPFPMSIELASLDGTNGFVLNGIDSDDESGRSVSYAGDINGDGVDDLIIGAADADPNDSQSGETYIVFGSAAPFPAAIELASLDGTNGFVLIGIDKYDVSGRSVSAAGDINGDGIADIIIGAPGGDLTPQDTGLGESYVVFGSATPFQASFELSSLNGANGFVIKGIDEVDFSGQSVSGAGDINGDGIDDLVIGAWFADPNGASKAGESYVVFGSSVPFPASLELASLTGINGFVINGIDEEDRSGYSVSAAGDINGDGVDDLVICATTGDPNGTIDAGEAYVVFGNIAPFPATLELASLDGANGFTMNGIDAYDRCGSFATAAGDINDDGVGDLVIGAGQADPNGIAFAGETYVVFGSAVPFPSTIELASLDGTNGFVINGVDMIDISGWSVSTAGDINGDGVGDLVIGAMFADPNGVSEAGETYVIFGRTPCPADLNADGVVDTADLGALLAQFNTPGLGADINGDGTVDTADLGILLGAFGTTTCD